MDRTVGVSIPHGEPLIVYSTANGWAADPLPPKWQLRLRVEVQFATMESLLRFLADHLERHDSMATMKGPR